MDDTDGGNGREGGTGAVGAGYDEWRCPECGHGHPKHTPPCDGCGHMELEQVHVSATDFDDELRGAGWLELVRENAALILATVLVVTVVGGLVATSSGWLVLSDPIGLGYKWGTVGATEPGTADAGTAASLRADLAGELAVESLAWRGRHLELAYRSTAASPAGFERELGTVAVAYAAYVEAGGGASHLAVRTRGPDGRQRTPTVERGWAVAYNAGELDREGYVDRVRNGGAG